MRRQLAASGRQKRLRARRSFSSSTSTSRSASLSSAGGDEPRRGTEEELIEVREAVQSLAVEAVTVPTAEAVTVPMAEAVTVPTVLHASQETGQEARAEGERTKGAGDAGRTITFAPDVADHPAPDKGRRRARTLDSIGASAGDVPQEGRPRASTTGRPRGGSSGGLGSSSSWGKCRLMWLFVNHVQSTASDTMVETGGITAERAVFEPDTCVKEEDTVMPLPSPSAAAVLLWGKVKKRHLWTIAKNRVMEFRGKMEQMLSRKRCALDTIRKVDASALQAAKNAAADAPVQMQGNAAYYENDAVAQRFKLRGSKRVDELVRLWWGCMPLEEDATGNQMLGEDGYIQFSVKIQLALVPSISTEEARATALEDWVSDSKGNSQMSYDAFFDAMFELVDLWCDSLREDAYLHFLATLLIAVAEVPPWPPTALREDGRVLTLAPEVLLLPDDAAFTLEAFAANLEALLRRITAGADGAPWWDTLTQALSTTAPCGRPSWRITGAADSGLGHGLKGLSGGAYGGPSVRHDDRYAFGSSVARPLDAVQKAAATTTESEQEACSMKERTHAASAASSPHVPAEGRVRPSSAQARTLRAPGQNRPASAGSGKAGCSRMRCVELRFEPPKQCGSRPATAPASGPFVPPGAHVTTLYSPRKAASRAPLFCVRQVTVAGANAAPMRRATSARGAKLSSARGSSAQGSGARGGSAPFRRRGGAARTPRLRAAPLSTTAWTPHISPHVTRARRIRELRQKELAAFGTAPEPAAMAAPTAPLTREAAGSVAPFAGQLRGAKSPRFSPVAASPSLAVTPRNTPRQLGGGFGSLSTGYGVQLWT